VRWGLLAWRLEGNGTASERSLGGCWTRESRGGEVTW